MAEDDSIDSLVRQSPVVVFHSPVTDLGGLDRRLNEAGVDWTPVELGMGNAANRELFHELKTRTGRRTLPQLFVHGEFVGGLEAGRRCFAEESVMPAGAAWMGYLGLMPFMAGMLGMWADAPGSATWLAAYGAVILSFVGAIHWGVAVGHDRAGARDYALSVLPALVGWVALLLPVVPGLLTLAVAFMIWRVTERFAFDAGLPGWFLRLRSRLTLGAVLSLAVGAAAPVIFW